MPTRPEDSPWLSVGRQLTRGLLDLAVPSACLGCEYQLSPFKEGRGGSQTTLRLCLSCRSRLRRHGVARCRHCARPFEGRIPGGRCCAPCTTARSAIDDLLTCYDYREPFDRIMRTFKFGGFRVLAAPLARDLWDLHAERLAKADVIVPVPSHWRRRFSRGFNPPAEIARHLARLSNVPVRQPLRRLAGPPQSRVALDQRKRNARRSFDWDRASRRHGRNRSLNESPHVLLLDDVTTTRATLETCARLLKNNGASEVTAACLGWTPPPTAKPLN